MKIQETTMIEFNESDVDLQLAIRAHSGTSHDPDERAQMHVADYIRDMNEVIARYALYATDENRDAMKADLEAFRVKYLELMNTYLHARTSLMSTLVAGRSNFNTKQNEKRGKWVDVHLERWNKWHSDAIKRLDRTYNPVKIARAARVVRSDDPEAIRKLREQRAKFKADRDFMKNTNVILRSSGTPEQKRLDFIALGWREENLDRLLQGEYIQRYDMRAISTKIRNLKTRIEGLKREAEKPPVATDWLPGVQYIECQADTRLRIVFAEKPSKAVCRFMRSKGFVFSGNNGAWQRLLNNNARSAAKNMKAELGELLSA